MELTLRQHYAGLAMQGLAAAGNVRFPAVSKDIEFVVKAAYLPEKVKQAVREAVIEYFDFENVDLGQMVHLSDVYRVMQDDL